jgi:hypothetical protein
MVHSMVNEPGMDESVYDEKLLRDVLLLVADADAHDRLWWSADPDHVLQLFVNCTGWFMEFSDVEPITAGRLSAFRQAFADTASVTGGDRTSALLVYVCRMRKARPQQSAYPSDSRLWPLLDDCGPEATDIPPGPNDFVVIVP